MIKEAIAKLVERKDLEAGEVEQVMDEVMTGVAQPTQIAAFLVALRMKGETIDEIVGSAEVMRKYAVRIDAGTDKVLDTCGTGGDAAHTFNISTISAFVACGAGAMVAKHGNRSVSSKCGSADLLKELGVNIEVDAGVAERCLREIGIGFLFAPLLHQAMKYAAPVRRELGIRTIFNILGPLTNPAGAKYQLLGVFNEDLTEPLAAALSKLGSKHVLVVHGTDGLDEITTTAATKISELKTGKIKTYKIKPEDFGFKRAKMKNLSGGEPRDNAKLSIAILKGEKGPKRDIVLLNSGAALYAANLAKSIKEGIELAEDSIDSGKAYDKLQKLINCTNK